MAEKHPYVTSPGPLIQIFSHLRKSFPGQLNADTLKKLGFAPKNESYIINALRYLGFIDADGNKTEEGIKIFSLHRDDAFQKELSSIIKNAYSELFALHGEDSWALDLDTLITFFRQTDKSSGVVGKRQANTFIALSGLSGHGEVPEPKSYKKSDTQKKSEKVSPKLQKAPKTNQVEIPKQGTTPRDFGLTVRIEINLPAEGDQETYDRIFKSIRENLLNA